MCGGVCVCVSHGEKSRDRWLLVLVLLFSHFRPNVSYFTFLIFPFCSQEDFFRTSLSKGICAGMFYNIFIGKVKIFPSRFPLKS